MAGSGNDPSRVLIAAAVLVGGLIFAVFVFGDLKALLHALTSRPSPEEREGIA